VSNAAGLHRARDILARAYTVAHRIDRDLPVTTRHTEQAAAPSLLDAARRGQLLVVGMGGGDLPQEVLIGSVALDVRGHSPCPVAVVRGHDAPAGGPVLVGIDDPATDAAALTVAFADARRHGGRVVVLHARHGAAPFRAHLTGHPETARVAAWEELVDALARGPNVSPVSPSSWPSCPDIRPRRCSRRPSTPGSWSSVPAAAAHPPGLCSARPAALSCAAPRSRSSW
jgi:hypothetical protein